MSHLNSLTFTSAPQRVSGNPVHARRQKLIQRLEEQRKLAQDPSYSPMQKKRKKSEDGSTITVERHRNLTPWWRTDANGSLVLTVRYGLRPIEFEKGKAGIAVGSPSTPSCVQRRSCAASEPRQRRQYRPLLRARSCPTSSSSKLDAGTLPRQRRPSPERLRPVDAEQ